MERAIITSCSNKFFPSLINLIGSIEANYKDHPPIFVYNLGLLPNFVAELNGMNGVTVLPIPAFCNHWRSCYTWKSYIFIHPKARLNFYLDAGCQVLRPLDEIFNLIESDGYFSVSQDVPLELITPHEFKKLFPIEEKYFQETCIAAGIFGFKNDSVITPVTHHLYDASVAGLTLGFSSGDLWKNKGVNKNQFVRGCKLFRHDTTLLSLLMRQYLGDFKIHDVHKFASPIGKVDHPHQLIWNIRLNYKELEFIKLWYASGGRSYVQKFNKVIITLMIFMKTILRNIKSKL